jgi:hypothetical protein
MKKLALVAVAALMIAGMTSCKKDYTCTCTVSGTSSATTIHDTKSKATDACNTLSTEEAILGGSCTLN